MTVAKGIVCSAQPSLGRVAVVPFERYRHGDAVDMERQSNGHMLTPFRVQANRLPLLGFHAGVPPAELNMIIRYLAEKVNKKRPLTKGAGKYFPPGESPGGLF